MGGRWISRWKSRCAKGIRRFLPCRRRSRILSAVTSRQDGMCDCQIHGPFGGMSAARESRRDVRFPHPSHGYGRPSMPHWRGVDTVSRRRRDHGRFARRACHPQRERDRGSRRCHRRWVHAERSYGRHRICASRTRRASRDARHGVARSRRRRVCYRRGRQRCLSASKTEHNGRGDSREESSLGLPCEDFGHDAGHACSRRLSPA